MNKIFKEIALREISPNPHNPRKGFDGPKFDELAKSVREKGVIEPIIVRQIEGKKTPYEIVAGERRYKAAQTVGLETIPALIRELSDDEAFDFMIVENLQRQDLTELEEAESFKAYLGKHGAGGAVELGDRTGIRPTYIRRRVAVLELPTRVLEAWRKGTIGYGHLEQLLRVREKGAQDELIADLLRKDSFSGPVTVRELREDIDEMAPRLKQALFETWPICSNCVNNSKIQKSLFDIDGVKDSCLNPKCFKQKQNDWLIANWNITEYHKNFKTNGFRFLDGVRGKYSEFYDYSSTKPGKKCLTCDKFVTILRPDGDPHAEKACLDSRCYGQLEAAGRAEARGKKAAVVERGGTRVAWHGEYFRNTFFRKRVPEIIEKLDPEDKKIKTLLLMCLAYANSEAEDALEKALGFKQGSYNDKKTAFSKLLELPYQRVAPAFRAVVKAVFLEGQNVGEYNGFGSYNRRLAAEFLGVDLAKEYAVDEEYLQRKTKAELLVFGKKSGILADRKIKEYLQKNFNKKATAEKLKKSELVDLFLKSGIELKGRVPDEILKRKNG